MVFLSRYAVRFLCPYKNFTNANEDVTKDLNKINVPTKIFHGVHDQLIPYKSAELTQQRIKNSQLHALTNSGHGSPIDQADELNKELIKFLHA